VEPLKDDELSRLLKRWQAPDAPESLRSRVLRRRRPFPLRWLIAGEIRVPVPVALLAACLLILAVYLTGRPKEVSLSDFQQVQQLQPRIVRTIDEAR
jgi:hypothetical protein